MITIDAAPTRAVVRRGRGGAIGLLVARRLAFGVPLLLVSLGMFVLAKASPFDPVQRYFGARIIGASAERVAQIRANWAVDAPVLTQYGAWLAHAVTGDFGDSHSLQQPVSQVIRERLGWSVLLVTVAFIGALLLGIVLGTTAAWRQGGWLDRGSPPARMPWRRRRCSGWGWGRWMSSRWHCSGCPAVGSPIRAPR